MFAGIVCTTVSRILAQTLEKFISMTSAIAEHIWWDQATALRQAGLLPTYLPYSGPEGINGTLRLPVAGVECARMLLNETDGKSNEMIGDDWGVKKQ